MKKTWLDTLGRAIVIAIKSKTDLIPAGGIGLEATSQDIKARTPTFPQGTIYFDSVNGEAGTAFPIGTAAHPVDNKTDLLTILAANPTIKKVQVLGGVIFVNGDTIPADTTFIGVRGKDEDLITIPAGVTLAGVVIFIRVYVESTGGDLAGAARYLEASVEGDLTGVIAFDSIIYGGAVGVAGTILGYNLIFDDTTIDFTGNNGPPARLIGAKGKLTLTNVDQAGCSVNIYANGLDLTIDASCTLGTINIYSSAKVTDNSAGATVNDYTIETTLAAIKAKTDTLP